MSTLAKAGIAATGIAGIISVIGAVASSTIILLVTKRIKSRNQEERND